MTSHTEQSSDIELTLNELFTTLIVPRLDAIDRELEATRNDIKPLGRRLLKLEVQTYCTAANLYTTQPKTVQGAEYIQNQLEILQRDVKKLYTATGSWMPPSLATYGPDSAMPQALKVRVLHNALLHLARKLNINLFD